MGPQNQEETGHGEWDTEKEVYAQEFDSPGSANFWDPSKLISPYGLPMGAVTSSKHPLGPLQKEISSIWAPLPFDKMQTV